MQIVWAKAGCGIWGLDHVFGGKLCFTKDIVDDNFVPRNRKPKPIPKPAAMGRFLGHAFFWYRALRGCTALSKHQDPV